MADIEEVEATLQELVQLLDRIDPAYRPMLPSRRTVEARCPDLGLAYHAFWREGSLSELHEGRADRAHITLVVDSDDLMDLAEGQMTFREAYLSGRVEIRASMTDLLRLRAVL